MSKGPNEYGKLGEEYYPEPLHRFLGEVQVCKLTLKEKQIVTQITSLATGVTVAGSNGIIRTYSNGTNNILAAATAQDIVVTCADYDGVAAQTLNRVRVTISKYIGTTGMPYVYVKNGDTTGSFTIRLVNVSTTEQLNNAVDIFYSIN